MFKITTEDPLQVLSSTKYVLENSSFVELDINQLQNISKVIKSRIEKGLDDAVNGFGVSRGIANNAQLIFIEDCVNFCFWSEKDKEKWQIEWPKGNIVKGGWYALVRSFERALDKNIKLLDSKYLENISIEDVKNIFKSTNGVEIPLINKRLENLKEAGRVLTEKYDGNFVNLIEESDFDAIKIAKNTYENFLSYRDIASFDGKDIYFLKRAQILANDLTYIYKDKIKRLNLLTAFADYKLPQILREYGALNYSVDLARKIDNYELIPSGSKEEIEIRSATVWAVELLRQKLEKYTASEIDNAIWLLSQDQTKVSKPYHRTYTIYY